MSDKNDHLEYLQAAIAQLGERQTEDLKVPGSIPGRGTPFFSDLTLKRASPRAKANVEPWHELTLKCSNSNM